MPKLSFFTIKRPPMKTWTKKDIVRQTHWSDRREQRMRDALESFDTDHLKEHREKIGQCRSCYYLQGGVLAGQAFTGWECKNCSKAAMHPNTNVPKICKECSDRHKLCTACGGKLK